MAAHHGVKRVPMIARNHCPPSAKCAVEESFDVRLGGVGSSGRRRIGQRRQACLCLADVVEQDDRVELRELRRERVLGRLRDGGMTITVPTELAEILRQTVAGGEYASTSEVVREALRDWSRNRDMERRDLEALRNAIRAGLDSGPGVPADQVFAELRARYAAKS